MAIVTRGHKHDALVLEEVMKRPTRYVGMIGSKRKSKLILDHLKAKGFEESALNASTRPSVSIYGRRHPRRSQSASLRSLSR